MQKIKQGEHYPLDLFMRQSEALHPTLPLDFMGILMVSNFEKEIYETKLLTKEKVFAIAKKTLQKTHRS
jgi:hypothetical protein